MRALNQAEQDFAVKNHNLVYTYLHKRNLDIDEFYDIVIFGYLRAVAKYHDRKDLQKYSFSNIAWRCMDTSFGNHCTSTCGKRNKLYTDAVRLDEVVPNTGSLTFGEIIASPGEVYSQIEYTEFFKKQCQGFRYNGVKLF